METTTKKRILTGDRPTGRLHLGHYVGSLVNRVRLQEKYETILIIADLHTLTTKNSRPDIEAICENARGMVLDRFPTKLRPIVQPIDDWNTNRKLGLLFECRLGHGRIRRFRGDRRRGRRCLGRRRHRRCRVRRVARGRLVLV